MLNYIGRFQAMDLVVARFVVCVNHWQNDALALSYPLIS